MAVFLFMVGVGPGWAAESETPQDEITVMGTTLRGRVLGLSEAGLRFETVYGKGEVLIEYPNIESIRTQGQFRLFKGDGAEIRGFITGIEHGKLKLIGAEGQGGDLTEVGVDEIAGGISEKDFESSWIKRFKARHPWWKSSLDLGWNLEETAIDKVRIAAGLNIERRRKPTRFVCDVRYAYDAEGPKGEEEQTTKDEFRGFLLGEYDLSRKWFCFVEPAGEFDRIRGVDVRLYPSLGVGYRFVETERSLLQVQAGPGCVYEEFINFGHNDYFAAQMGVEARHRFGKYLNCALRLFYMPGIPDYRHDWLFGTELDVGVPITEFLSMNLSFTELSDNNPAPDVGDNKITTTLGLAITF